MKRLVQAIAAVPILLLFGASPAFAHVSPAEHSSFLAGFTHPLSGLDHILVMVAVGLWAAMIGGRAIWMVPTAFVGSMAVGFGLALGGVGLPFVEPVILASVVALGLLVAAAVRLSASIGMIVVGAFAVFHGHAHGSEVGAATMVDYGIGFTLATALLHVVGIGLGLAIASGRFLPERFGNVAARSLGGVAALLGVGLAAGWL
jgi:urease accessory protein